MPATQTGIRVAGVDGCPVGWIAAIFCPVTGKTDVAIADSFAALLDGPLASAQLIVIDMPIGLSESPGRTCEKETRRAIGLRRSSVFPSPLRGMLAFDNYEEANAFGKARGAGLSKQAWNITAKIREIDQIITPPLQARVVEGHPELSFTRLAGAPCTHAKRTPEGKRERLRRLKDNGINDAPALLERTRAAYSSKRVFDDDDLIDALALALTAKALLGGEALRFGDGARDARGLLMEICG